MRRAVIPFLHRSPGVALLHPVVGLAGLLLLAVSAVSAEPAPAPQTATAEAPAVEAAVVAETTEEVQQVGLELIMADPDWLGNAPFAPYWADDGRSIYYERKRQGEEFTDLWRIELDGDEPLKVMDEERGGIDVDEGNWTRDRTRKVYSHQGDLFVKDIAGGEIRQLTRTADREHDVQWMVDEARISYQRGGQFYVRHLDSGLEEQPVVLALTEEPEVDEEPEGFLAHQQLRLFDVVKERRDRRLAVRDRQTAMQEADRRAAPRPFYLGDDVEIQQQSLSPDGRRVALVLIAKSRDDGKHDSMPDWVTDSGYVENHEVRVKVGTADGTTEQLVVLDLETHQTHEIDLSKLPGITDDPLAELRRQAEERAKAEAKDETEDADGSSAPEEANDEAKPRSVRFEEPPLWSPDGENLLVRVHSYDNKDRWIAVVEGAEPALRSVHRLHDEAWINWFYNEASWLSDSRRILFLSEESGWSQLYLHDLESETTRRLTDGDYVVSDPQLTPDESHVVFTANVEHPGHYEVYRVPVAGGPVESLTRLGGRNGARLSPDGGHLLITHDTTTRPPELWVQDARPEASPRQLTNTVSAAFTSLRWTEPEIVAVPSRHHDRPIVSRFYPAVPGSAPDAGHRAVVFIHGAGYLQNAHQGWSGYFREFMFHTLLTQRGYSVLDMDYRASAGYGRDWRTAIYRHMGSPELEDLSDGVAWLVGEHGVEPERVGVYGGSYGGFLTMMAMFKQPDLFACGAALRPVTDWAHYNHPYTANILNTPELDPLAYERSSPIELAAGLEKPLLICAPMQDDNVFFQDTVRLAQRLIELEKEDWQVALFPVEPHGFQRPSSWLDEYRRILALFETHLR